MLLKKKRLCITMHFLGRINKHIQSLDPPEGIICRNLVVCLRY